MPNTGTVFQTPKAGARSRMLIQGRKFNTLCGAAATPQRGVAGQPAVSYAVRSALRSSLR
jgi:hypothetical protein